MARRDKAMEMQICQSVIKALPDDQLIEAHQFFSKLSDYKRIAKLYDTYVTGIRQSLKNTGDGKIYVNYNIDGTKTGRLSNSGASASKKKDDKLGVSFHTLPREAEDFNPRNCFVAPNGWKFITIDKKAMELRVLAHVANERNMIKAFESGRDLHDYSTEMTFGIKKSETDEKEWKQKRQICKEVSFLTVYGGTAITLAGKRNISEEKAQGIIDNWMGAFPGVRVYMDTIREYVTQFKYAKTIFGRYRHLPNIDSPVRSIREGAFRQGLNFTIQSPASDILLCAMIGLRSRIRSNGMRSKIIGTVHDSIEIISPPEEVDQIIKVASNQLLNYPYMRSKFGIELKVPLEIDIQVGSSFGNGESVSY